MAIIPNLDHANLTASSVGILNGIRELASPQYQAGVPEAQNTLESIRQVGASILGFQSHTNEFLHTLERNEIENGNNIIALHDYEKYGYTEDGSDGLKEWYEDYMQNSINGGENKGLTEFAYKSKPIHEDNFKYSVELDYFNEPENVIEEINSIIKRIVRLFNKKWWYKG